jgi:hypothetical protein
VVSAAQAGTLKFLHFDFRTTFIGHVLLLINCFVEGGLSVAVFAVIQNNVAHLVVGADILINYQTPADMGAYLDRVNRPTN